MNEMTKLALVGTANLQQDAASLAALAGLLPAGNREQQLLWQAGARAVYEEAGQLPRSVSLPTPAANDSQAQAPAALWRCLLDTINGDQSELGPWLVARLQLAGYRAPISLLPQILAKPETRALWQPLLGERGRWLAAQNPDWSLQTETTATDPAARLAQLERDWQEGTLTQRRAALAELRRHDAALARDWLSAVLPKEKAEQRLALLESFASSISADDEALLEGLLADRSQAVRQLAANLLAGLPDSACAARLAARADTCLIWQGAPAAEGAVAKVVAWFGKGQSGAIQLTVNVPTDLPKDWERDGIVANPPYNTGKRAWWLQQLLALVPPQRWCTQSGATPDALLPILLADEWAEALLTGIAEATCRFADAAWATALFEQGLKPNGLGLEGDKSAKGNPNPLPAFLGRLWPALPEAAREAALLRLIVAEQLDAAYQCLFKLPAPWPASSVRAISRVLNPASFGEVAPGNLDQRIAILELAVLRCGDDALPALSEQVTKNLQGIAARPEWTYRYSQKRAERSVELATAKQTIIKEIPL